MYECLQRNGYFCPVFGPFMTWQFMEEVRTQQAFLPKMADVKMVNVPSPPTQKQLVKIVIEEVEKSIQGGDQEFKQRCEKTIDRMKKYTPDKEFLLGMLKLVSPNHEIFNKNYTRPQRQRDQQQEQEPQGVQDPHGFF